MLYLMFRKDRKQMADKLKLSEAKETVDKLKEMINNPSEVTCWRPIFQTLAKKLSAQAHQASNGIEFTK